MTQEDIAALTRAIGIALLALCLWVSPISAQGLGDPQIGGNDFRISDMGGPPGDPQYGVSLGTNISLAHDRSNGGYLVCWSATDTDPDLHEIYGRLVSPTGALLGPGAIKISDLSQGNPSFNAFSPSVAFNPDRNEYLVVWYGKDFFLGANGFEIFGQRVAMDGSLLEEAIRISDMGDETNAYWARDPVAVYNPNQQEYLVVWYGDDNENGVVDGENEIFGQRLDGLGMELGSDFRISDMGVDGSTSTQAFEPDVAFDPVSGFYLVVWQGSDGGLMATDEFEIFGQLLTGAGGEIGSNDFRISDLGGTGNADFDAQRPAVAFDRELLQWLVVWDGDDDEGGHADDEFEIFGQLLTETGVATGVNDFRISSTGPAGDPSYFAFRPAVLFDEFMSWFYVAWEGNPLGMETEIYGAPIRRDNLGNAVPYRAQRLSDMGPDNNPTFSAEATAMAQDATDGHLLAIWQGSDDLGGHVSQERDIFGQRLSFRIFDDGFESGSTSAWDSVSP